MRTSDALSSNLTSSSVATSTGIFTLFYLVCGVLFVYLTYRIMKEGPEKA